MIGPSSSSGGSSSRPMESLVIANGSLPEANCGMMRSRPSECRGSRRMPVRGNPHAHWVARVAIVAYSRQGEICQRWPRPMAASAILCALLAAHHRQTRGSKRPSAGVAHVVAFHFAILQIGKRKVQVADTAARRAALAGNRTILLEDSV